MAPNLLVRLALILPFLTLLTPAFAGQAILPLRRNLRKATLPPRPSPPKVAVPDAPVFSRNGTQLPPYNTEYWFDQLIDHTNPGLGTFKQRFYHSYEWYQPGGPIVFFTPGEEDADGFEGYLGNRTVSGQIAQQEQGAAIVLEHRFYGLSNPYNNLSQAALKYHTIQQAIDDIEYFAKTVNMPMPNGDNLGPDKAPWVMVGGSYSGALTSYVMVNKPDLFWAGYASSAVVQTIENFWAYFDPARQFMPQNCSNDVQAVIAHVDDVLTNGSQNDINHIKGVFGMTALDHLDDVAGALRNPLWNWQGLSPDSGPNQPFFQFCDALEVKDGVSADAKGWGLDHALAAWGQYYTGGFLRALCGGTDNATITACLGTYDPTEYFWTDIEINNSGRSWTWIVCNEVGFYQEGAPSGTPTTVSRLLTPAYDERQCQYWFPETFKSGPPKPATDRINFDYDGWYVDVDRLYFANGQRDPWRDATLSSDFMTRMSTPWQPIGLSDAYHCSDLITDNGVVDATVQKVQQKGLQYMKQWLAEWQPNAFGGIGWPPKA